MTIQLNRIIITNCSKLYINHLFSFVQHSPYEVHAFHFTSNKDIAEQSLVNGYIEFHNRHLLSGEFVGFQLWILIP